MRTKTIVQFLFLSGSALVLFCFDRLSKLWAEQTLADADLHVVGDFLRLHLTYNRHIAFSIPVPEILQIVLSVILLVFLLWYFTTVHRPKGFWEMAAVSLIFGGALGNLVDRIMFGQVTDFIAVWKFPVFNLADTFLFLGVVFFLGQEIIKTKAR